MDRGIEPRTVCPGCRHLANRAVDDLPWDGVPLSSRPSPGLCCSPIGQKTGTAEGGHSLALQEAKSPHRTTRQGRPAGQRAGGPLGRHSTTHSPSVNAGVRFALPPILILLANPYRLLGWPHGTQGAGRCRWARPWLASNQALTVRQQYQTCGRAQALTQVHAASSSG